MEHLFRIALALCCSILPAEAQPAEQPRPITPPEEVEAIVLVRLLVNRAANVGRADGGPNITRGADGGSASVFSATVEKTVLCRFHSQPLPGEDFLEYNCVILASTLETDPPDGRGFSPIDDTRWTEYQRLISAKQVHREIRVDQRGRTRILRGGDSGIDWGTYELEGFPTALFPPLPQVGQPFEAGKEWTVKTEGLFVASGGVTRCERARVWTDGDSEVVLSFRREHKELKCDERWVLRGNPPSVREYWGSGATRGRNEVTRIERHARVLSGGIPVRPVESLREKKEESPPPE